MQAISAFSKNASNGFDTRGESVLSALHMTIITTIITTTGGTGGGSDMV
jgi:hypothetical protein